MKKTISGMREDYIIISLDKEFQKAENGAAIT